MVTLTPTNMREDLTVTITINDELANYYFGKPVYRTYIDKFAGHSYLIEAKFNELDYPVSDVITVVYRDTRDENDKWIDRGLTAYELYKTIKGVLSRPKDLRVVLILEAIKHENDIQWWVEEVFLGVNHFPVETDNNDVIGG